MAMELAKAAESEVSRARLYPRSTGLLSIFTSAGAASASPNNDALELLIAVAIFA